MHFHLVPSSLYHLTDDADTRNTSSINLVVRHERESFSNILLEMLLVYGSIRPASVSDTLARCNLNTVWSVLWHLSFGKKNVATCARDRAAPEARWKRIDPSPCPYIRLYLILQARVSLFLDTGREGGTGGCCTARDRGALSDVDSRLR